MLSSVIAAGVALTCASERSFAPAEPPPSAPGSPPSVAQPAEPGPVVSSQAAPPEPSPEAPPEPSALARFRGALQALERGGRRESVRILWLGDSHTAADFMTGAVRSILWQHYTPGGPGFVRLGAPVYRHDRAAVTRIGRFRVEPEPPSRRARQDDGVFGLGGMRVTPTVGATVTVKLGRDALRGKARHQVLFDLAGAGAFQARLGGRVVRVPADAPGRKVPGSPILRLDLEGGEADALVLEATRGQPRFYGLVVEGSEPGVVLDTVGINGARVATALAWAEEPFVAEVRERKPDLLVIAYGTNEAFDGTSVERYAVELTTLLQRLRRGAPSADCLVLGPPDALEPGATPLARVAQIAATFERTAREIGCAFVDGQALMGGPGGFLAWQQQKPPLAQADRIHLTPDGYRLLGSKIAAELLGEGAPTPGTAAPRTNSL